MNPFTNIRLKKPKRNKFDLSHDKKLTLKMGELIPIMCQEILPSDTWYIDTAQVMRMAPMLAPIMHKIDVYTHFFFVPNRILWENSEKFFTGGESGTESPVYPYVNLRHNEDYTSTNVDYLGMPSMAIGGPGNTRVSAFPFAGLAKIYNEYYRDQNLQEELPWKLTDGDNTANMANTMGRPLKRAWRHDYFTSNLPFPQKGPDVLLPIGGEAPLVLEGTNITPFPEQNVEYIHGGGVEQVVRDANDGSERNIPSILGNIEGQGELRNRDAGPNTLLNLDISNTHKTRTSFAGIVASLKNATSNTITDLRTAFRLQEWLERNARAGSRYSEFLKAHFGVTSSDARLQRPEYLGGGKSPIVISEVLQTSATAEEVTPLATMGGHGLNVGRTNGFNYYSEEHGFIIGIMSVIPRADYYQGIPRQFTKFDRMEHFYPTFAHLGEQETKNKEIFVTGGIQDEETFGYLPRYTEYRYIPNTIHGEFRESLEFWHLGRKFENAPQLNSDFIECDPSTRIFAVEDGGWEQLYCQMNLKITAKRPLPFYGTPTF